MMAATCGCQSVSASACAGSKTVTVRRSSRLRPLSWLWADPSGAVVAETSWIAWRRVGWLSLTPTIRATLADCRDGKKFFWQCRASSVTMAPGARPSSASKGLRRRDLVGLLGDVDVGEHQRGVGGERAQHLSGGAVVEPVKPLGSTLPRSVLPSRAMLPCPGVAARRLQQRGMAAESSLHPGRVEPLEDVADGGARRRPLPVQPKAAFSLRRWTSMKVTMPRYELHPATMARMENSST